MKLIQLLLLFSFSTFTTSPAHAILEVWGKTYKNPYIDNYEAQHILDSLALDDLNNIDDDMSKHLMASRIRPLFKGRVLTIRELIESKTFFQFNGRYFMAKRAKKKKKKAKKLKVVGSQAKAKLKQQQKLLKSKPTFHTKDSWYKYGCGWDEGILGAGKNSCDETLKKLREGSLIQPRHVEESLMTAVAGALMDREKGTKLLQKVFPKRKEEIAKYGVMACKRVPAHKALQMLSTLVIEASDLNEKDLEELTKNDAIARGCASNSVGARARAILFAAHYLIKHPVVPFREYYAKKDRSASPIDFTDSYKRASEALHYVSNNIVGTDRTLNLEFHLLGPKALNWGKTDTNPPSVTNFYRSLENVVEIFPSSDDDESETIELKDETETIDLKKKPRFEHSKIYAAPMDRCLIRDMIPLFTYFGFDYEIVGYLDDKKQVYPMTVFWTFNPKNLFKNFDFEKFSKF